MVVRVITAAKTSERSRTMAATYLRCTTERTLSEVAERAKARYSTEHWCCCCCCCCTVVLAVVVADQYSQQVVSLEYSALQLPLIMYVAVSKWYNCSTEYLDLVRCSVLNVLHDRPMISFVGSCLMTKKKSTMMETDMIGGSGQNRRRYNFTILPWVLKLPSGCSPHSGTVV